MTQTPVTAAFSATYDSDGRRASENGNRFFLYDGDQPVEEMGSGASEAINYFGPDGLRARSYPAGSYINNVVSYTYDPEGNLVERYDPSYQNQTPEVPNYFYDAYGNATSVPGVGPGNQEDQVGFGGQWGYYHDPTGLYLLGSRYYDPSLGRFLTRDTIGYQGGANLYAFCGNNPINHSDPEGTDDGDDILPASASGGTDTVGPLTNSIHQLAGRGLQAGNTAASFNPWCNFIESISGQDAAGNRVSTTDRAISGISVVGDGAPEGFADAVGGVVKKIVSGSTDDSQAYSELRKLIKGMGLDAHHLLEKRFAPTLNVDPDAIPSFPLSHSDHVPYTKAWRTEIGYGKGTDNASVDEIYAAARKIYAGVPDIIKELDKFHENNP